MHSSTPKVRVRKAAVDEVGETIDGSTRVAEASTLDGEHRRESGPPPAVSPASDYPELVEVERRHYVISGEIASGGMGRVLEARDLRLGRPVAIKELLPKNRDAARRFEREARITARLQHPSIINIYEAGRWTGGEPFFAMTKVSGRSLSQVVSERTALAQRMGLLPNVIAVADAMAYAHSKDVIHRDLKPGNILVGEFGETVVIDWGLAKDIGAAADPAMSLELRPAEQTLSGSIVGTPAYMPPEQARGEPVDQRADVYALGALLYKVLVGKPPYDGTSSHDVLDKVLAGPPVPVEEREPEAPDDLVAIVRKAMAREPDARYPSAGELAADLKRFETGQLVAAHHYTRTQLVWRWLRRHRVAVAITSVAVAIVAIGATVSVRQIIDERNNVIAQKREVERKRAALLEERGRTELLAGRAGPALANLVAAFRVQPSAALGFMIAEARRPFEAQLEKVDAGTGAIVVAYRPDGTEFATASASGRIALWDAVGHHVRDLDTKHGSVRAIAWSPDGALLVTAGDDRVVRLWFPEGPLVRELAGHRAPIGDVAFSTDGTLLVTASADDRAHVYRVADGKLIASLVGHDSAVTTARLSPDGTKVVTGTESGVANVFDVATGKLLWPLRSHTGLIHTARWSPSGDRVLTSSADGTARIWDPDKGKAVTGFLRHDHSAHIFHAAWSADGRRVITAGADKRAIVWQLPDPPGEGELPRPAREEVRLAHEDSVVVATFFDDRWIVTAGNDNRARVWDRHGRPVATFEHADAVSSIAMSPDGSTLVSGCRDGSAYVWDLRRSSARTERDLTSSIHALAVSRDGTVAAGTDDSRVTVWRDALPRVLRRHRGRVFAVAFSPDGSQLVTAGEDPEAFVWTVGGAAEPAAVHVGDAPVHALAIAPDGTLAIGDDAGVLRVVSSRGRPLATTPALGASIVTLAFSPNGEVIAGGTTDGYVHVWNVRGDPVGRPYNADNAVRAVAFDATGDRLVVAGARTTEVLRALGGETLTRELTFDGSTGDVAAIAVSRDREAPLVFTGGGDGMVRVWDGSKGKLLATRQTQGDPIEAIEAIALSPDEQLLWTGTADGIARAWTVGTLRDTSGLEEFMKSRVPWRLGDDDVVVEN